MRKKRRLPRRFLRAGVCFAALLAGFTGVFSRLIAVQNGAVSAALAAGRRVHLDTSRGFLYDRALRPLVYTQTRNLAAVLLPAGEPFDPAAAYRANGANAGTLTQRGVCCTFETETPIPESAAAVNVTLYRRYAENQLCRHLIGYLNAEGRGVSGLEKAFDRLLTEAGGAVSLRYEADADGHALLGSALTVENGGYASPAGLVLTLDRRFQIAAETALTAGGVEKGAAVVLRARDSAILALASVPVFDPENPAASLEDPALPFLNRALAAYPVGSVFKPFVAAAAIDAGLNVNGGFVCDGTLDVSGVSFSCYNKNAHGETDLTGAIVNSCNTYFIDLARRLGGEKLRKAAAAFGFGSAISLTGTIRSAAGALPSESSLEAPAALANFGFGQGEFTASPLQLAAAYAALARGGLYLPPYLLKAIVDDNLNETAYYEPEPGGMAASAEACRIVNESLYANMQTGTGVNGRPKNASAAGKTATAQTGALNDRGAERLCTWFCGFAPFEEPAFVIVVFREDGEAASQDCAPVFRMIAERILHFRDAA